MQCGLAHWFNTDVGLLGCYPGNLCRADNALRSTIRKCSDARTTVHFPEGSLGLVLHLGFSLTFHDGNHESYDLDDHYLGAGCELTLWLDVIQ
jgi:hypothetical protein